MSARVPAARKRAKSSASHRIGILFGLGSALAFATMGSIAKTAYSHGASVSDLLAVRFSVGAVFWGLLAWPRVSDLRWRDSAVLWALAAGAVGGGLAAFAEFEAYRHLPVAMVVVLLFTNPIWLALAQRFFKGTRLGSLRLVAIASVVGGVLVLAGPIGAPASALGVSLSLGASLAVTVLFVGLHRGIRELGIIITLALVACSAAVVTIAPAALGGTLVEMVSSRSLFPLAAGLGIVSSLVGWGLLSASILRIGALDAAVVAATEPLMAGVVAWFALGETLTVLQIVGAMLVVAGTIIIDRARAFEADIGMSWNPPQHRRL